MRFTPPLSQLRKGNGFMKVEKVIITTSVVLIVAAFGFYLRQHINMASAPSTTAIIKPSSTPQTMQTQPQLSSSPILASAPNFVSGHKVVTQPNAVPSTRASSAALPPDTVATVNGAPITAIQLDEELNRLLVSPNSHGGIKPDKKEELRNLALEELVVRELAYQQAQKIGLTVSNQKISSSFKRIKKRYKTAKDFNEALKAEKITEQDLKKRIERDLLLKKINQVEIEDRARVSEAEAKQHYEENKTKFVTPVSIRLWNIVVKVEAGKETEAKRKIDEAYKLLREGKDFYGVAYKYSSDDYSIFGGDYGWVHRGQLATELETVVFGAKENEITGPFQTDFGWHIIKVGGVRPEKQLKYEEVKEKIKKGLYQQRIRQTRIDFINRLKTTATVEYIGSNK